MNTFHWGGLTITSRQKTRRPNLDPMWVQRRRPTLSQYLFNVSYL